MENQDILVAEGLLSLKDIVAISIEIEAFRKGESGTGKPPGDVISEWLRENPTETTARE